MVAEAISPWHRQGGEVETVGTAVSQVKGDWSQHDSIADFLVGGHWVVPAAEPPVSSFCTRTRKPKQG